MPPRKRALEQSDANMQPAPNAKQQKRDEPATGTENEQPSAAGHDTEAEVHLRPHISFAQISDNI